MPNFKLTPYLWLIPFICFLVGYQLLYLFQPKTTLPTPNVVGEPLYSAIKTLSAQQLNLRISQEQVDPNLPDQVIVSQKPYAGQAVKSNQTVYVVVSRKPQPTSTPNLIGKTAEQVHEEIQALGLKQLAYPVPSAQPINTCVAQQPEPGAPLHKNQILTYISAGTDQLVLMPDFSQLNLADVIHFLQQHQLKFTIVHLPDPDIQYQHYYVTEQRPLPGTLVNLTQLTEVKLKVAPVTA